MTAPLRYDLVSVDHPRDTCVHLSGVDRLQTTQRPLGSHDEVTKSRTTTQPDTLNTCHLFMSRLGGESGGGVETLSGFTFVQGA